MGSRFTFPPSTAADNGGNAGFPPNNIFQMNLGMSDLALGSILEFTKFEIEYGFAVDTVDKIQMGRVTVLWDRVAAIITSHEIETSENLGEITTVSFIPYIDGNNLGLRFDNQSGEVISFQYNYVNKFNIVYTPNPPDIINWNTGLTLNSTFSISNLGRDVLKVSGDNLALIQSLESHVGLDFSLSFNVNANPMIDTIVGVDRLPQAVADESIGGFSTIDAGFRFVGGNMGTIVDGAYSGGFLSYVDTDLFVIEILNGMANLRINGSSFASFTYNIASPSFISMMMSNTDKIKNLVFDVI